MTEVVELFPEEPTRVWICGCGCSTFTLIDDGTCECANCEQVVGVQYGGWAELAEEGEELSDEEIDRSFSTVNGNGSPEFVRRRLSRIVEEEPLAALIIVRENGAITTWTKAETKAQLRWLMGRLRSASKLLRQAVEEMFK